MTRPFQYHTSRNFLASLLLLGWLRYKQYQSITHMCRLCSTYIFYHIRLFWYLRELSCSNWILSPRYMYWVWNLRLLDISVVLFKNSIDIAGGVLFVFFLPIMNNLLVRYWDLFVIGSYLSTDVDVNLLSISDNVLSNTDICWILGSKSSRMSHQRIIHLDSLRVATLTIFLWYENTFIL